MQLPEAQQNFYLPASLPSLLLSDLYFCQPHGQKTISLIIRQAGYFLKVADVFSGFFFYGLPVHIICPFFCWTACLPLSCNKALHISDVNPFSIIGVAVIFLQDRVVSKL